MIEPQSTSVLGSLGINGKLFLAQLVNFGVVVFVMWKWVYTPLLRLMDKRAKDIAEGVEKAKRADGEFKRAQSEKERILKEALTDAHAMLQETRDKAEAMRQEKLHQTKAEIERLIEEAKVHIASERDAAATALQRDVADLVMAATEKVVGGVEIGAKRTLIARALEEVKNA